VQLADLARVIQPEHTVVLLGAGASIASGSPTGAALARHLASKLSPSPDGEDLSEISGIFENRLGRTELVEAVSARLRGLQPTGGLLALPAFPWRAIYSTNFDRLVEESYRLAGQDLPVVRSNFDFSRPHATDPVLYKLHGCITQDVGLGHRARMVLTELDYDEVQDYRQSLFNSLRMHMTTANTIVVGQSLKDPHLRDLAKQVGSLRQQGVQGRVFLLAYDYNQDRASLLEQRGIEVAEGSLEQLLHALEAAQPKAVAIADTASGTLGPLPSRLLTSTLDVAHASGLSANPVRLFNGGPATYADISRGLTIARATERRLEETQNSSRGFFMVLAGAAGVGKTTLARRLLHRRQQAGFAAWEHLNSYPLNVDAWLEVESALRHSGRQGVLLIDDCAQHLSAMNKLVDSLGKIDRPFLRLVATVNASQWKTRTKSRYFYSRGSTERLSLLTDSDIREMVNLVDRKPEIRAMVEADFLHLGHQDKVRRLRDRCSADMFVCLKNIFRTEKLDNILLQEFTDLETPARDIYRHVAAIQSMGGKVHRQLIMRLLGLEAGGLQALLGHMDGVVDEYDIRHSAGLYGWATRHDVIAGVIATYKFADQRELYNLLDRLIEGLNPTIHIELETARAIAADEMGISRLSNQSQQVELLEKLISVVPGERTPRRRLIRLFLNQNDLGEAERAVAVSQRELGPDNIIDRYRAVLAMRRSEQLEGLLDEDRLAMLLEAERLARGCIAKQPYDRYNYRALSDVGIAIATRFSDVRVLDATIEMMKGAEADIGDPEFARDRRQLETSRRRFTVKEATSVMETGDGFGAGDETILLDSEG
jgi:GTPase SAR1 family protein